MLSPLPTKYTWNIAYSVCCFMYNFLYLLVSLLRFITPNTGTLFCYHGQFLLLLTHPIVSHFVYIHTYIISIGRITNICILGNIIFFLFICLIWKPLYLSVTGCVYVQYIYYSYLHYTILCCYGLAFYFPYHSVLCYISDYSPVCYFLCLFFYLIRGLPLCFLPMFLANRSSFIRCMCRHHPSCFLLYFLIYKYKLLLRLANIQV